MISAIAAFALLIPAQNPSMRVVSASLFKNGYAVVTREAPLSGPDTMVEGLPVGSLGTMWITATPGVTLQEVARTEREQQIENPISSLDDLLAVNKDRTVTIEYSDDKSRTGVVKSVTGSVLILESADGIFAIPKNQVLRVMGTGLTWTSKITKKVAGLRVKSRITGANPKLIVIALERGITWAPAYSVDISDEKKLSLVSKTTILNDLADLENIELRLITGFPNLPWVGYFDPLTSGMSVDQFTAMLIAAAGAPRVAEPRGLAMAQNAMRADRRSTFDEAFEMPSLPGISAEDLFFYRLPGVNLKAGERGYHILFKVESDYQHVYTWDVPDAIAVSDYRGLPEGPGDVWHSLKFKNTSERPFTTAPATTFKDGELLGQDLLYYVSAGADALVRITKALDVRAEGTEEELERQRLAIHQPNIGLYFDLVTVKGTLQVKNRKTDKVRLEISKEITGDVVAADGDPKITKTAKGLRQTNPRAIIEWSKELAAGESLTLTYTYKVYVRTHG